MKKYNSYLLLLSFVFAVSCSSEENKENNLSFDEKVIKAIDEELDIKVDHLIRVDTKSLAFTEQLIVDLESSQEVIENQQVQFPQKIDSSKMRIKKMEENMENTDFESIRVSYETIIDEEKKNLKSFESLLEKGKLMHEKNGRLLVFLEEAVSQSRDSIGYYLVEGLSKKDTLKFGVSSTFVPFAFD